jgi:dCMP deaminase
MRTDAQWFSLARQAALASPDTSRKTGCVLVYRTMLGVDYVTACNTFPDGVAITKERLERPTKYTYTEHAERNAIYALARRGQSTLATTIFLPWYPCADCARALVQAGVGELVCTEPDWTEERYGFVDAQKILDEGGVKVRYIQP